LITRRSFFHGTTAFVLSETLATVLLHLGGGLEGIENDDQQRINFAMEFLTSYLCSWRRERRKYKNTMTFGISRSWIEPVMQNFHIRYFDILDIFDSGEPDEQIPSNAVRLRRETGGFESVVPIRFKESRISLGLVDQPRNQSLGFVIVLLSDTKDSSFTDDEELADVKYPGLLAFIIEICVAVGMACRAWDRVLGSLDGGFDVTVRTCYATWNSKFPQS
jgi:hypothetical protein